MVYIFLNGWCIWAMGRWTVAKRHSGQHFDAISTISIVSRIHFILNLELEAASRIIKGPKKDFVVDLSDCMGIPLKFIELRRYDEMQFMT